MSRAPLTGRDFSLPLHFLQKQNNRSQCRFPQKDVAEEEQGSNQSKGVHHQAGVGHSGHTGHRVVGPAKKNQEKA